MGRDGRLLLRARAERLREPAPEGALRTGSSAALLLPRAHGRGFSWTPGIRQAHQVVHREPRGCRPRGTD